MPFLAAIGDTAVGPSTPGLRSPRNRGETPPVVVETQPVEAAPLGIELKERVRHLKEIVIADLDVYADAQVSVLEARITGEYRAIQVAARPERVELRGWLAFARDLFPGLRTLTREEQRELDRLNAAFYEELDPRDEL